MTPRTERDLCKLRPQITNVLGFYELLYEQEKELTPYKRMIYETHFATSSHAVAMTLLGIINEIIDREQD